MADGTTKIENDAPQGLDLLRSPFPERLISKLPKPTKKQTQTVKDDYRKGIRCQICGGWHHPDVVHLDYVGHAALTDRLLDCDPEWDWRPLALNQNGLPAMDRDGGMWIELTVCGVTRKGYGNAPGKSGGDATKEIIGDALRNAAMRFGAALDLWHKGDLHLPDESDEQGASQPSAPAPSEPSPAPASKAASRELYEELQGQVRDHDSKASLADWGRNNANRIALLPPDWSQSIKSEYEAELKAFQALEEASKYNAADPAEQHPEMR